MRRVLLVLAPLAVVGAMAITFSIDSEPPAWITSLFGSAVVLSFFILFQWWNEA